MSHTDELLDQIAAYADRLAESDKLADTGSMAAAKALAELYDAREWVPEWLEQKPIREHAAYVGGRPPQPDSRNRFAQWLVWKEEQRKRHAVQTRHTYRLLYAHELSTGYLSQGHITSERTLRPLDWLRKYRYLDRVPEVWARAVELAGGSPEWVTSAHTRQALTDWKKEALGTSGMQAAVRTKRAESHRLKAQTAVAVLWADGDPGEVEKFKQWLDEHLRIRRVS